MLDRKHQKNWDANNPEKVQKYKRRYKEKKIHATVVLEDWVIEQIDKEKKPGQAYGTWLRQMVETWAREKSQNKYI